MGLFGGRLLRGRFGSSTAPRNEGKKLTSAQRRQLRQLKTQLDGGLLTKKEYAAKRKDILNDL